MEDAFTSWYGRAPEVVAHAPGRVNLMGEHTDYNGGAVLPIVIPQRTTVTLARRTERTMRVTTALDDGRATYVLGEEVRRGDWADYVRGCTWALAAAGSVVAGADVAITSTVPAGSGLSSSAALEVALLRALREANGLALDNVALARIAHRAEVEFVGARTGLMDQLAVSLGDRTSALHLDTRTLAFERVPWPDGVDLVVLDSGVRHALASGDYNQRRAECERAAGLLGVEALCLLGPGELSRAAALPAPLGRRVRHVVTEHARVGTAVEAMRAGDVAALGQLFLASHASQRDDYQVSVPEVDCLVELAWADPDVHGARLTGGGFGGAVVLLARDGTAGPVAGRIGDAYRRATGRAATRVVPVTS